MKKSPPKLRLPGKSEPQTRWFLWYFLVTMLVLWGWQELFNQFSVRTIPYSQFKAHLARREVTEAAVKPDEIVGRIVPLAVRSTNAPPVASETEVPGSNTLETPVGLSRALAEPRPFLFRTMRVFFWEVNLGRRLQDAFLFLGIVPVRYTVPEVARLFSWPEQILPFLSSMFLHGGWTHLLGNVWTLWIFGDNVEDRLGRPRYFLFYLLGGVAAALLHIFTNANQAGNTSTTVRTCGQAR
jgi:hypothetical protein